MNIAPTSCVHETVHSEVPQNVTTETEPALTFKWDPVAQMSNKMPPTANEDPQPAIDSLKYENSSPEPPQTDQGTNTYWPTSYQPFQVSHHTQQSEDTVEEKLQSAPQMLFTITYNLTTSGSIRLNIGIEKSIDDEWRVVLEFEKTAESIKIRFNEHSWTQLCRAEPFIENHMSDKYYEAGYGPPHEIECGCLKAIITILYDDVVLCVKSGSGSVIYLQHSSVTNLFGMIQAVNYSVMKLEQQLPYVKSRYREISEYLRVNIVHEDDLHKHIPTVIPKTLCSLLTGKGTDVFKAITLLCGKDTDAEFIAHRKSLFQSKCKGEKTDDHFFSWPSYAPQLGLLTKM